MLLQRSVLITRIWSGGWIKPYLISLYHVAVFHLGALSFQLGEKVISFVRKKNEKNIIAQMKSYNFF
jgi:hypothetical protein